MFTEKKYHQSLKETKCFNEETNFVETVYEDLGTTKGKNNVTFCESLLKRNSKVSIFVLTEMLIILAFVP
jgi:hypothetical protein